MNFLTTNTGLLMQRSLDYLWEKQSCIMDNIANIETPGYQTKYVTFENALEEAIQAASEGKNPGAAIRNAIEDTKISMMQAKESMRQDGNSVDISEQTVEMVRNAYQMQHVMNAISGNFSTLRTVIRG